MEILRLGWGSFPESSLLNDGHALSVRGAVCGLATDAT